MIPPAKPQKQSKVTTAMAESVGSETMRDMKRLKMLKFNARVASIKHAQSDLMLKDTCSKFDHEADHKRRLHLKEVNQLQYDFRIMQVSIKHYHAGEQQALSCR